MTFFNDPNPDAMRGTFAEGSAGPLMGFLDAFDASWTSQQKVHSYLAVEQGMRAMEQEQIKRMRQAGLRPHSTLDEAEPASTEDIIANRYGTGVGREPVVRKRYEDAARQILDGQPSTDPFITEQDKAIVAARVAHPELNLLTYGEMALKLREQSQEIERKAQGPTSTMGDVGGFLGGAAASMDPRTDPLNAMTAPFGWGRTIAGRVAAQAGLGGFAETLGQVFTPDAENILLGHAPSFGERAARVGLATAGGALLQGTFEGGAAVARRVAPKWFADLPLPADPRPRSTVEAEPLPPSIGEVPGRMPAGRPISDYPDFETFAAAHGYEFKPHGSSREAQLRSATDLNHVSAELNRWDGPQPWEVKPPTATAPFRPVEPGDVRFDMPYQRYIDSLETVDDIARRLDPDTFRLYDGMAQERNALRAEIDRDKSVQTFFDKDETARVAREMDSRAQMVELDEKMRDLAPLVSRAYAAADAEWRTTPMDWNTLRFLQDLERRSGWSYRENGPTLTERPLPVPSKVQPTVETRTPGDAVPMSKLPPDVEANVKLDANADVPTRVAAMAVKNAEAMDAKVEAFVGSAAKVAKLELPELKAARENALKKIENAKRARAEVDVPKVPEGVASAAEPTLMDNAVTRYGLTREIQKAGFAFQDGKLLDMSEGGPVRMLEHYDVRKLPGVEQTAERSGLIDFMAKTGAARIDADPRGFAGVGMPDVRSSGGVLSSMYVPSTSQIAKLVQTVRKDGRSLFLGADDLKGNHIAGDVLEKPTVEAVQKFFREHVPEFKKAEATPAVTKASDVDVQAARERADAAVTEAQQELDDLTGITMPNGTRIDFNEMVPYVDETGVERQMSALDFLREMQKDDDALKSVMTCSRPS